MAIVCIKPRLLYGLAVSHAFSDVFFDTERLRFVYCMTIALAFVLHARDLQIVLLLLSLAHFYTELSILAVLPVGCSLWLHCNKRTSLAVKGMVVYLSCYHAPVHVMLDCLQFGTVPVLCLVGVGTVLASQFHATCINVIFSVAHGAVGLRERLVLGIVAGHIILRL